LATLAARPLIWVKANRRPIQLQGVMGRPFLYRCPVTGMNVQGLTSDDEPSANGDIRYEPVTCLACGQLHLVDPSAGPLPPADKE
jgi:hypothetical protein